mmetsp:Transcript_33196/g.50871  ORF Transcript_33196/g.50871 Transcript_33196/m.50871 type:complete len:94 (-) Transcript_33196:1682-1963(-)
MTVALKQEREARKSELDNFNLDKRLAAKDLKLREEKITDLKRELLSVQRERVDKVETIKGLQSRIKVAEENEKATHALLDKTRTELKSEKDEI